jgi:glucose/arabinose dehydrogenase
MSVSSSRIVRAPGRPLPGFAHGAFAIAAFVGMTSCRTATAPAPAPVATAPAPVAAQQPAAPATPALPAPDPSRFQQDVLLEGVFYEPTEIAVARDGRVFIAERHGKLSVYDPEARAQRLIRQLAVNDNDENGLIGLALDPGFDTNHWLYLNYSVPNDLHHRLARFTLDGDSLRDERSASATSRPGVGSIGA